MKKTHVALISIFAGVILVSLIIIILFFTVFNKDKQKVYDISHYIDLEFELNDDGYSAKVAKKEGQVIHGDLVLPAKVSSEGKQYEVVEIPDNAFADGAYITSIKLPSTLKKIGNNAFQNCSQVKGKLQFPSGLNYIGQQAFAGCTFEGDLEFPSSVTYIGSSAFSGCTFEGSITFSSSLSEILPSTFEGCAGIKGRVAIPSNIHTIGVRAFYGCENMGELLLADGLTDIEQYAFYNCGMKGTVNIPDTIAEIKEYSFANCLRMRNLHLSEVETIGTGAFKGCSNIETLTIPSSVTSIEEEAFSECTNLKTIVIESRDILCEISSGETYGNLLDLSIRENVFVPANLADNVTTFIEENFIQSTYDARYPNCIHYVKKSD